MKTYKVLLTRSYVVYIDAKNEDDARRYSEFFIEDAKDCSTEKEQRKHHFKIGEMEIMMNEAFDAEEVKEF